MRHASTSAHMHMHRTSHATEKTLEDAEKEYKLQDPYAGVPCMVLLVI